jgi:hypothetical protein
VTFPQLTETQIVVSRAELSAAYHNAPPRDMGTVRRDGRLFRAPSQHTGVEAVAQLVAQHVGIELVIEP